MKNKIILRKPRKVLSKELKDKMIQEYLNGKTFLEASKIFNVSESVCMRELRRRGIESRSNSYYRKLKVNEDYFEKIDTEEKAYWLGFITADGCLCSRNNLHISLKYSDRNHLKKFLKSIESSGKITDYFTTNGHWSSRINTNNTKIYNDLKKYGITPRKSLTGKIYKFEDSFLEAAYWRGLVDGDGWFFKYMHKKNKNFIYDLGLSGNCFIVSSFLNFIENNNIKSNKKSQKNNTIRLVRYTKKDTVYEISNLLYKDATIYLDRKYNMYLKFISEYNL